MLQILNDLLQQNDILTVMLKSISYIDEISDRYL